MKVKFTTTLEKNTIERLQYLCIYYNTKNINDVIEKMVEETWEDKYNAMEAKQRSNREANKRLIQ